MAEDAPLETPKKKESITGLGVAIWFAFIGPVLAFVPTYLGLPRVAGYIFLVLAGFSLLVAAVGGLIELSKLGLLKGGQTVTNVGIAAFFGFLGLLFHFAATRMGSSWIEITLKLLVVFTSAVAALFVAAAIGDFVQNRVSRKATTESRKTKSTVKLLGALFLWLATMAATILQSLKLLSELLGP